MECDLTVGREASRLIFTVLLARIIGPEGFGIVALATVYIGVVGPLLTRLLQCTYPASSAGKRSSGRGRDGESRDRGAAVAGHIGRRAAVGRLHVNAAVDARFGRLAPGLLIRAAAITPRALLLREMAFRKIGIVDRPGVVVRLGLSSPCPVEDRALVVQHCPPTLCSPPRCCYSARVVGRICGFVFCGGSPGFLAARSRGASDQLRLSQHRPLLIGRFLGRALGFLRVGNRVLLLPVRLVSTTVGGVLFPAFSRLAGDLDPLRTEVVRATRVIAVLALPAMALISAAAPQLVQVLFGDEWLPAVPIVQVLALAGALQTIYQPTTAPLILGLGHARLDLRYAWLSTLVSTAGIVGGLPFGAFGVAVGYTIATGLLVPVEWLIRRRLLGLRLRGQAATLWPGCTSGSDRCCVLADHDHGARTRASCPHVGARDSRDGRHRRPSGRASWAAAELLHLGYRLNGRARRRSATADPRRAAP